jgi:hypothetical protein
MEPKRSKGGPTAYKMANDPKIIQELRDSPQKVSFRLDLTIKSSLTGILFLFSFSFL